MFTKDFYPTPRSVAYKMLAKIDKEAKNYLEPSAGKGDLAEAIREWSKNGYRNSVKVDCIESSPELAMVLCGKEFPVVGYDWLTYSGVCYYDAIVMNPPFSSGAEHLLRAWDFLHNGEVVCLLNQETIDNPCTVERRRLATIIAENGTVESLGDCFRLAERGTVVNVAMVHLKKVAADDRIDAWETSGVEKPVNDDINAPDTFLAIKDDLGNMEHYYNQASEHMLKAFQHIRKASLFMDANGIAPSTDEYKQILSLATGNINSARAEFTRTHRKAAWMHVFNKMQFRKWLDKKQTDEFIRDIERSSSVQFTADNIKGTLENVFLQRSKLFEKSVANVFDELTRYFKGNTNHAEGWKSNDDYKVNLKLVFPYGCRFDYGSFALYYNQSAIDIYNDLDRILCVLDGENFEEVLTIYRTLSDQFHRSKQPGIVHSRYFEIRYFKKGTIHLKWKRKDLWEKFNIKAAAGKKWIGHSTQAA